MIDYSKRNTLKIIVGTSAAVATGGATAAISSEFQPAGNVVESSPGTDAKLGQIEVSTRVSVVNNDLEVIVKNTANEAVTVTHLTPRTVRVARGEFDFSALLKDGPLHLESGEFVALPLQHKMIATNARTLTDVLKNSMSVITDANSFASVSIMNNGAVA